jgi:hypothetical protein
MFYLREGGVMGKKADKLRARNAELEDEIQELRGLLDQKISVMITYPKVGGFGIENEVLYSSTIREAIMQVEYTLRGSEPWPHMQYRPSGGQATGVGVQVWIGRGRIV